MTRRGASSHKHAKRTPPSTLWRGHDTHRFAAVDAAAKLAGSDTRDAEPKGPDALAASLSAERGLLRAIFTDAPAPLFLLEGDGTIRRANGKAGELIGAPPGYATGKPLTAFVDLPSRATGLAGRSAAETTRMIQSLVTTFSEDQLRDEMTILIAKVKASPDSG